MRDISFRRQLQDLKNKHRIKGALRCNSPISVEKNIFHCLIDCLFAGSKQRNTS